MSAKYRGSFSAAMPRGVMNMMYRLLSGKLLSLDAQENYRERRNTKDHETPPGDQCTAATNRGSLKQRRDPH